MSNRDGRAFQWINSAILLLIGFTMIAPIFHLLAVSLSSAQFVNANRVHLWPKEINFDVYERLLQMDNLWRAMGISIYITAAGTFLALLLNASIAYSLSRPHMKGRKWVIYGVLITFIFQASLIPSFLIVKELGMLNTLWALTIPNAVAAFYIIIFKAFFKGISAEIFEAAKADGCSEYRIFLQMIVPLSLPVLATIALFHAVHQWNNYFQALIFMRSSWLFPLQLLLRNLVTYSGDQASLTFQLETTMTPKMMKAGVILFATLPIAVIYPFLQKYFAKGAMLGSLKE